MRALRICQRGTASVEIVVMLPVFIILFFAVYYFHGEALARQYALSAARGCALQYAVNGCRPPDHGPDLCEGLDATSEGEMDDSGVSDEARSVIDKVNDWPLLGKVTKGLFGEVKSVKATRENPGFMGGDPGSQSGKVYAVCNTISETWAEKGKGMLCDVAGKILDAKKVPGCS